jgi:MarR family transcriptional regulator, 2-MHQ and catechol-resistance regulon repressor
MTRATASAKLPAARRARGGDATDETLLLWVVLSRAYAAIRAHAEADIARYGIMPTEFGILEVLYHKGPLLLGEIQRKILVSSGGVTFLVDRLVARGLVERRECPGDRRARYAALTKDGERLMADIFPQHAAALRRALSGLSGREQRQATALLRKLGQTAAGAPLPVGNGAGSGTPPASNRRRRRAG